MAGRGVVRRRQIRGGMDKEIRGRGESGILGEEIVGTWQGKEKEGQIT